MYTYIYIYRVYISMHIHLCVGALLAPQHAQVQSMPQSLHGHLADVG